MGRDHVPPVETNIHHHPRVDRHMLQCHRAFPLALSDANARRPPRLWRSLELSLQRRSRERDQMQLILAPRTAERHIAQRLLISKLLWKRERRWPCLTLG
jgi:hypothetical protein